MEFHGISWNFMKYPRIGGGPRPGQPGIQIFLQFLVDPAVVPHRSVVATDRWGTTAGSTRNSYFSWNSVLARPWPPPIREFPWNFMKFHGVLDFPGEFARSNARPTAPPIHPTAPPPRPTPQPQKIKKGNAFGPRAAQPNRKCLFLLFPARAAAKFHDVSWISMKFHEIP